MLRKGSIHTLVSRHSAKTRQGLRQEPFAESVKVNVKKPIALLLRLEPEHEQALNKKLDDKKPIQQIAGLRSTVTAVGKSVFVDALT